MSDDGEAAEGPAEEAGSAPPPPPPAPRSPRAAWLSAYVPALIGSSAVGLWATRSILALAHEPAAPLDDSFIHFQYARRLAEGGFFRYVAGEGYSSGATSFLWPLLLAPFHLLGARDVSLIWIAWIFGTIAHAGLAVETFRLSERLAGRAAAAGAGAMSLLFAANAWFAWSGMETILLAWALLRGARAAAAYCEPLPGRPTPPAGELIALGLLAPLVRPEGAIVSLIAALALFTRPRSGHARDRLLGLAPLGGPAIVPLIHLAFAGHATSSTTMVKWLLANPTYTKEQVRAMIAGNVHLLLTNILDGGDWTAVFLPEHFTLPLFLGAMALATAGLRRRLPFHAIFTAIVVLGTLLPCTYLSFLWNRVRYVWPFAGAWFVMLACLCREAGDLVRAFRPRATYVAPVLAGLFAGALAAKLPWAIHDLSQSAHAIDRQQVLLGRWASEHLPADARIGVNDTGAIAYLSGRRTFDVVGLTTEGEARYWVAGPGSRFEHYEKLSPERRPTHFIVYPHWMSCPPVLGRELYAATVTDQTILGGQTMVVYEARWDALGSGARPAVEPEGMTLADELDVADLESEDAHRYDRRGALDQDDQVVTAGESFDEQGEQKSPPRSDGGRMRRSVDRFTLQATEGKDGALVLRVGAEEPLTLVVSAGDREVGRVEIPPGAWVERSLPWPSWASAAPTALTVSVATPKSDAQALTNLPDEPPRFASFHYWLYSR
ncbi:MAG: hypothetical protein U0359_00475 [Byssovorax sp.]